MFLEISVYAYKTGVFLTVFSGIHMLLDYTGCYPIRQRVILPQGCLSFLKEHHRHGSICSGVCLKGTVWQPNSAQQVTAPRYVAPCPVILFIHGASADAIGGNKGNHAARADLIYSFCEKVIMNQEALTVIPLIHHLIVSKRNITDGEIKETIREICPLKPTDSDIGLWVELLGNTPGDAVQLHTEQLAFRHTLRQQPEEIAHTAGRLQDFSGFKAHTLHSFIHCLDDHRTGIVGVEGGGFCEFIFLRGQQPLQLIVFVEPSSFVFVKGVRNAAPAHITGKNFLLRSRGGTALPLNLLQGADRLNIHPVLCPRPAYAKVVVGDAEVSGGNPLSRFFLPVRQFVGGGWLSGSFQGGRFRGHFHRGLLNRSIPHKQARVALILAQSVHKEIPVYGYVAPGIRPGVDANVDFPDIFNRAGNVMVMVGKYNMISNGVGGLSLQMCRFQRRWVVGETVQLLQPEAAKQRGGLAPLSGGNGFFVIVVIQNVNLYADR